PPASSAANGRLAATRRVVGTLTIAQGTPARRRWPSISTKLAGPSAGWPIREITGNHRCALDSSAWDAGAERAARPVGGQGSKRHQIRSPGEEGPRRAYRDRRPRRWWDYAVS